MKKLKIYLLLFFLVIVQSTIISKINIFGIIPNLVLVFAISYSLNSQKFDAVIFCFVCGLSLDLLSGKIIGFNAILFTYLGYSITFVGKKFFYSNLLSTMSLVLVTSIFYETLYCFLNFIIWQIGTFKSAIPVIVYTSLYNVVASIAIHYIFVRKFAKNSHN